jgi:magnesium-transporting ATPase (P-type)
MHYALSFLLAFRFLAAAGAAVVSFGIFSSNPAASVSVMLISGEALSIILVLASHAKNGGGKELRPYVDSISRIAAFFALSNIALAWAAVPLIVAIADITIVYCRVALAGTAATLEEGLTSKILWIVHAIVILALAAFAFCMDAGYTTAAAIGSITVILSSSVAAVNAVLKAFTNRSRIR